MKTAFVLLLCVAVAFAQPEQDLEDGCECALGPGGEGLPPYPCGHDCGNGYHCHLTPELCPAGATCQLSGSTWACACATQCTSCGQVVCGEVCTVGCPAEQTCVNEGAGYFCKSPEPVCTPSCDGKLCGETDGCGGRCAAGACPKAKDICGGGGLEFVCGRPKNPNSNGLAWGLIGGGLGIGACAGGLIYVKRRQRKSLIPADLKAGQQVEASACVEVETDQGTSCE